MSRNTGFYSFRELGAGRYQTLTLELVPPERCQLRCSHCYQTPAREAPRAPSPAMPKAFAERLIDEGAQNGFSEIAFVGGEPTLHRSLPQLVARTLERGLAPIVVTNGLRLAQRRYAEQVALPGTTLVLHAPLPAEVQDPEAARPGYAAALSEAYENLRGREGVKLVAELVLIEQYYDHVPAVFRWCLESGVVPFIEANRRNDARQPYPHAVPPDRVGQLFEALRREDPAPPLVLVPPAYGNPCTMSATGLHVKNAGGGDYGGVYSCCAQGIRHGDARTSSLASILESKTLGVFQDQDRWIAGPCRDCAEYAQCRGGCRGEAWLEFGCARASTPSCWRIPAEVRDDPAAMAPASCGGCPLEGNAACRLPALRGEARAPRTALRVVRGGC